MEKIKTFDTLRTDVNTKSDEDVARMQYVFQIGSTFVYLCLMEETIISSMAISDKVKVSQHIGEMTDRREEFTKKLGFLESSTLGNLINLLSKHSIQDGDLAYLKWLKEKRDFFVHKFFRNGAWPGEISANDCYIMVRRLLYLEIVFRRAQHKIWSIIARANLMVMHDLGADGRIFMNENMFGENEI